MTTQKELVHELKSKKEELEYKLHNDSFRTYKEIVKISEELNLMNKTIKILEKGK